MSARSNRRWGRVRRLTLAVLMTVAWSGAFTPAGAQPRATASGSPGTAPQAAADTEKAIADLNRLVSALEIASRQTPRDTFDPQAVLELVGRNPVALFEWVRDRTRWVPYQGSLRGAQGVLMDRSGNSLDRALLLAELVRTTGVPVRLARGSLPPDQAAKALAAIPTGAPPPAATPAGSLTLEQQAAAAGLDPAALRQSVEKTNLASARLAEDAMRQSAQFTPALLKALGAEGAGVSDAAAAGTGPDAQAAIADHWWVEAQLAPGVWTALDPLLPDAAPGRSLVATPAKTFDPLPTGAFALPPDQLHTVEIRVVIEQWKGAKATEATVLSEVLRPSELLGRRVTLQHVPIGWPDDKTMLTDADPIARYRKAAAENKEWLPTLNVGEAVRSRASFTTAGEVNESPSLEPTAAVGRAAGGLFGGLGSAVGGGNEGADVGVLTAEWLEYVIRSPGRPDSLVRRQVFDLRAPTRGTSAAGPVLPLKEREQQSRGLVLLGETQLILLPCDLSPEFVADLTFRALVANRDAFVLIQRGFPAQRAKSIDAITELVRKAKPLPSAVYNLAIARHRWSPVRDHVYLDRPNVLALHARIEPEAAGATVLTTAFDVVANDVAVRGRADPFKTRLQQGVADTVAESVLLSTGGNWVRSAASAFEAAAGRGDALVTLRTPKDLDGAAFQVPVEVRQHVARDLADGYVVVLPSARMADDPLECGWWRVDPRTGHTIGVGGLGWGQALTEKAFHEKFSITVRLIMVTFGLCAGKFTVMKGSFSDAGDQRTCACYSILAGFAMFATMMTGNVQAGIGAGGLLVGALCA